MFSSLMTNHKKHPKIHQYVIHSGIKYACIYADFHYTETLPKSALTRTVQPQMVMVINRASLLP